MTIRRVEALQLAQVLGTMLGSIVDAQAQSARATVDFIDDVGFEPSAAGDKLRTISVRYTKRDENDELAEFEVEVPLLALVNIPSLSVSEAKLSFAYELVTAAPAEKPTANSGGLSSAIKVKPAVMTGFVRRRSSGSEASRSSMTIDVDVTLEQQEVPVGVERLFDLAELGITETLVEEEETP